MISYLDRLETAVDYLVIWLKVRAPKKSGNLALNAIKKTWNPMANTWDIVIGGELAPYAVYTNEIWIARPGVNPNQGWIQTACIEAKPILQAMISGIMTQQDIDRIMVDQGGDLNVQFKTLAIKV